MAINLSDRSSENPFWKAVEKWWEDLEHNKGARAELRKAKTPLEVYTSHAFQRNFIPVLRKDNLTLSNFEAEKLALPIGVLSHVQKLSDKHTANLFVATEQGKQKAADFRFRKLLSVAERDDAYVALIRMVKFFGRSAEITSLICGGYWWNDITRREWAREYFASNYDD